jgi:hypothetical protein
MSRFVRPDDLVTLPLSDGDTITIRRRLTHGEAQEMYRRSRRDDDADTLDRMKGTDALVVAYLVDWTFRTDEGRVEPVPSDPDERLDVICNLDQESFGEILRVINAHHDAQAAQKKTEAVSA